MEIKLERILSRLEELYQCGAAADGTYTRMAYSPEDVKGRETFMGYFRKLGLEPRMDAAGNLIVRLEGEDPGLPAIMTGSHLDTVPDGGKYDGVVGCVAGLEVCETLLENGRRLKHPLEKRPAGKQRDLRRTAACKRDRPGSERTGPKRSDESVWNRRVRRF